MQNAKCKSKKTKISLKKRIPYEVINNLYL